MRVAYLGPAGTYSHEALVGLPGADGWHLLAMDTIHAAVLAVQEGSADRALVPLENSLEGAVRSTLDALALEAPGVEIAGEVVHPVHHCLIAPAPVALEAIRVVLSHPQATAQCGGFLRREMPGASVSTVASTAEAVRLVVEVEGDARAAIGSRAAAALYGGHVVRAGIEDVAGNETRFAWLAPTGSEPVALSGDPETAAWRTALVWWGTGSTSPGWLVRCLSEFAFRGVNLTRIESRPRRQEGTREYMFFVDADGRAGDPALAEAIAALRGHADTVRVLGSHPAAA